MKHSASAARSVERRKQLDECLPAAYPQEFRGDVVAVARGRGEGVTLKQVAVDFGISEATPSNWLTAADVEAGVKPGLTL